MQSTTNPRLVAMWNKASTDALNLVPHVPPALITALAIGLLASQGLATSDLQEIQERIKAITEPKPPPPEKPPEPPPPPAKPTRKPPPPAPANAEPADGKAAE
jgi:hypothetical protein